MSEPAVIGLKLKNDYEFRHKSGDTIRYHHANTVHYSLLLRTSSTCIVSEGDVRDEVITNIYINIYSKESKR